MSSAGTQGLLSPQGMGMLSPLSIQKPHSHWGCPILLTHTWSVSPRVPFLLAHRHTEFQQPRGLCTCGPSAGTPSKFLPQPGSFSYEANRKSKLQSGAPPPSLSFPGLELWVYLGTWRPDLGLEQEEQEAGQKSKRWWRWGVEAGRKQPPPGSGPLHPPPIPACCPEGSR